MGCLTMNKLSKVLVCLMLFSLLITLVGCSLGDVNNISQTGSSNIVEALPVSDAVEFGSLEAVKEAVEAGGDVNATITTSLNSIIPQTVSLYEFTTMNGIPPYSYIGDYLLKNGADLNYLDSNGLSPLMNAAGQDNVEACKQYVSYGADINFTTKDGLTALDEAAVMGAEHTAEYLISLGLEPTFDTLKTALEGTARGKTGYKHYGTIKTIVEEMIALGIETQLDPIVEASICGNSDAVINAYNSGGLNNEYINWVGYNTAAFCNSEAQSACVSIGFSVYQEDENHQPIEIASRYNNVANVQWMMEQHLDEVNSSIGYAFQAAVDCGHIEVVKYFLSINTPIQARELDLSPLSDAAMNGNIEMLEILLAANQDISADVMWEALYQAASRTQYAAMKLLIPLVQLSSEQLHNLWTTSWNSLEQLQSCVEYGANPNDPYMLYTASENGLFDVAKYVLENGTDPNADNGMDTSPLMTAVRRGYLDIAQLLIESGSDVNYEDNTFGSIISMAAMSSSNLTTLLIDAGVNVNSVDLEGNTPLMNAVSNNQIQCAKILLKSGANTSMKNNDGETARDLAVKSSNEQLIKLFS